ncbi:pentapeptide repeat-containing protein [Amycolatopsis sp. NPDC049252]|uniref:pentapeptide repeat-containing protein n=1 Tax=Amycolatopsis sp. NPDC049252 TaxID=3363933 RepID=UPI0037122C25
MKVLRNEVWRRRGATWWWRILVIVVPVAVIAAAAVTLLLVFVDADTPANRIKLIKTGLTVGAGTGGIVALVLTGRRQWTTEHDATERRLTELYLKAVEQLGSDKAAIRHGGCYALERVAQDNPAQRQTVVNVLCAYLRMPYDEPAPAKNPVRRPLAPGRRPGLRPASRPTGDARQEREVRLTVQRILQYNLNPGRRPRRDDPTFWHDIDLDLTGATLIDFSLLGCHVGSADFTGATFIGDAWFDFTSFADGALFNDATFTCDARFPNAVFGSTAWFSEATFSTEARFTGANFAGGAVFREGAFAGDAVFALATFSEHADFGRASFAGAADFEEADFAEDAGLEKAHFAGPPALADVKFRRKRPRHRAAGLSRVRLHQPRQFQQRALEAGTGGERHRERTPAPVRAHRERHRRLRPLGTVRAGRDDHVRPGCPAPSETGVEIEYHVAVQRKQGGDVGHGVAQLTVGDRVGVRADRRGGRFAVVAQAGHEPGQVAAAADERADAGDARRGVGQADSHARGRRHDPGPPACGGRDRDRRRILRQKRGSPCCPARRSEDRPMVGPRPLCPGTNIFGRLVRTAAYMPPSGRTRCL